MDYHNNSNMPFLFSKKGAILPVLRITDTLFPPNALMHSLQKPLLLMILPNEI